MSLNWAMLTSNGEDSGGDPVLLPGEQGRLYAQDKIKAVLEDQSSSRWEAKGRVWISNQRIVVIAESGSFRTLNIPLTSFKNWKLEQPWFSANYINGTVVPTPGGGLQRPTTLTLTFTEGGAIEFTTVYRNLMERVVTGGKSGENNCFVCFCGERERERLRRGDEKEIRGLKLKT
ncbi:hypothetical protein BDB00DRAFT_842225 [Zychaea mexicana]|uniref:uncharacterized protein n=1 Tax=Zychaea mexicana TaxID=64656 RepID=UPI0022FE0C61|nr:uncharacterized protein BDB00DRAFT_842225 [Zychaea mexicana]KAI9489613.1 hypothetical protein BDB00DRAFT_842225 [Zychaea mexicana]